MFELFAWWVVLTAGPAVAAASEPVTSSTDVIVKQGPWAAATVLVFGSMAWLAKKVIERGWADQVAAIKRLEDERDRAVKDRQAAEVAYRALEAAYRVLEKEYRESIERIVPLMSDTARLNTVATDVLRERRRDQ